MYTNLDKQVELRNRTEEDSIGVIAPVELSVDGFVTELTDDVELVLRRRAARAKSCPWLR